MIDATMGDFLDINASITISLSSGMHTLTLSSIPSNCSVIDGATREATVRPNQSTTVSFQVVCALGFPGRWVGVCDTASICVMDGHTGVWTRVIDGSQANLRHVEWPSWSPDGSRIVFAGTLANPTPGAPFPDNSTPRIWIANSDGTGLTDIAGTGTSSSPPLGSPDWSPAGDRVTYARRGGTIWLVTPTGANATQVYSDATYAVHALAWSPTSSVIAGAWLVANNPSPVRQVVFTIRTDGTTLTQVSPTWSASRYYGGPGWVPNGQWLSLVAKVQGVPGVNDTLVVMGPSGQSYQGVATFLGIDQRTAWSPDGQYIAFTTNTSGLWIATPGGTPAAGFPYQVPQPPPAYTEVDWGP